MEAGERLDALESDMGQIMAQLMVLNSTLQTLINNQNPVPNPTASTVDVASETERATGGGTTKIKPAPPSDFDGDHGKGRAFLNSCKLYLCLSPNRFPNELSKIYWALTYMKTYRSYMFANCALRHESITNQPRFCTWAEFRKEFIKEFFPRNETQRAITRLETTAYFQGKGSVDDYIDKFKDLIDLSGYTDGLAIVVKFRRGLDPEIQNYIAQMMEGRPVDGDIETWYSTASRCDENRATNATFHSSSGSTSSIYPPLTYTPSLPTRNRFTPLARILDSEDELSSIEQETVLDLPKLTSPNRKRCPKWERRLPSHYVISSTPRERSMEYL